jgi:hypothetical protein
MVEVDSLQKHIYRADRMEHIVSKSNEAFELLKGRFGQFDNLKLLLDGGPNVTPDIVRAEFLEIAKAVSDGRIGAVTQCNESALEGTMAELHD